MTLHERFERILELEPSYEHLLLTDASFYVEREGGTLRIYFEWSNGKTDWLHNLNFPAKPYKRMDKVWFVHRGFLKVWKSIEPRIQPYVYDLSVEEIEIMGYSHGAAIALLCHEYCKYNRADLVHNIHSYGFGCPRVAWGFIPKRIKQRFQGFTVIRNDTDIVTHVPPKVLGFRHVGTMLHIGRDKHYNPIDAHRPESYLQESEGVSQ